MADDRNRNYDFPSNAYGTDRDQDYGRDYGSGRDYSYSSAREFAAAGEYGDRDQRNFRSGGTGYGGQDRGYGRESYGSGNRDYYGGRGGQASYNASQGGDYRGNYGTGGFRGSYASDGHRFAERDDRSGDWDRQRDTGRDRGDRSRGYGRAPQGYDYQDRGFFARAGDEVRSWFGDDDAERRREHDQRYDERLGGYGGSNAPGYTSGYGRDADYTNWRRGQIDALDRDYHEYRQENAKQFESEFGSWRTQRQSQRSSLGSVNEHMEVVGSDGEHVGTVDKVRGDRIILTKNDEDAGGRHHSIPSRWISSVDDKVRITKSAGDAQAHWRDEERSGAMFGNEDRSTGRDADGNVNLNRSFSGTY